MTWFKVDDKLWGHPKWLALSPRARALWITAGSWCADQGTDGKVPAHVLATFGARRSDAKQLVDGRMWEQSGEVYSFHDWANFQPDTASTRAKRAAESNAGALGNHRRWHLARGLRVPECEHCEASGT